MTTRLEIDEDAVNPTRSRRNCARCVAALMRIRRRSKEPPPPAGVTRYFEAPDEFSDVSYQRVTDIITRNTGLAPTPGRLTPAPWLAQADDGHYAIIVDWGSGGHVLYGEKRRAERSEHGDDYVVHDPQLRARDEDPIRLVRRDEFLRRYGGAVKLTFVHFADPG